MAALARQQNLCASCGATIHALGRAGQEIHAFGESAEAHHMKHAKSGGDNTLANCVVLCWSCHYSVHEGGSYRFGAVEGGPEDFPYFYGDASKDKLP